MTTHTILSSLSHIIYPYIEVYTYIYRKAWLDIVKAICRHSEVRCLYLINYIHHIYIYILHTDSILYTLHYITYIIYTYTYASYPHYFNILNVPFITTCNIHACNSYTCTIYITYTLYTLIKVNDHINRVSVLLSTIIHELLIRTKERP